MDYLPFKITDVFEVGHGFYNKKPPCNDRASVPFIGASGVNNGVTGFTTMGDIEANSKTGNPPNEPISRKVFAQGTLVTVNNGSAIGYTYYQPAAYTSTHDVNPLTFFAGSLSLDLGLYLAQMVRAQGICFEYAHKWRPTRMVRSSFMLPVDDDGNPDWDYMSSYAEAMRQSLLERYKSYVAERIAKLEYREVPGLDEVEWQPFYVADTFEEIERGKRLKKADQKHGEVPYASSTASNNGIDGFIEASAGTRVFGNCISLANSGSVGSAFYEPFDFVASDHVTHLKTNGFSEWIYLFLATAVRKQSVNFNFNREINDARIKKMQIMLPVTNDGKPYYAYMEQYAMNMMLKKYEQYLDYLKTNDGNTLDSH